MLELRYNGCPGCRDSAEAVLRAVGMFPGINYKVTYHDEHKDDKIYKKRPDYLTEFTGAILINPDTQHWIDFYSIDRMKLVVNVTDEKSKTVVANLVKALSGGE